jgi:hypothetical protein
MNHEEKNPILPEGNEPVEMTPELMDALMRRPEYPSMTQEEMSQAFTRLRVAKICENLVGKVSYYFSASRMKELAELFAHTEEDRITMPYGVYLGTDAAERCFVQDMTDRDTQDPKRAEELKGRMMIPDICTPLVEVAGDGKTARGLWVCPGLEAHRVEGGSQGWWSWFKLAVDFCLTENGWKIWHMAKYPYFAAEYEKSWVESPKYIWTPARISADQPAPEQYYYAKDAIYPDEEPAMPLPYHDWSEVAPGY